MKECILLIPNNIKKDIIFKVRRDYYNYNVKFMSLEEFYKKCTFDYDIKSIYYLMKEFNIKYDTALVYLKNIYYINDKLNNEKMNKLINIKKYLDENNLLIYNKYFINYIKNKKIFIYGYDYINKQYLNILSNYDYEIISTNDKCYKIDKIYHAKDIEDEVLFTANEIIKLIKNGININNIKLIIYNEYKEIIYRIFSLFKIPINIKNNSIYSIKCVKDFIDNLDNLDCYLEKISDNNIYNKIINILNRYSFVSDKSEVKELIICDLKNTYINNDNIGIQVIDINDYIKEDDHIFLLGFNKENIPSIFKDNDYFTDNEKRILNIDTSDELNIKKKIELIKKLFSIKNLTISYKDYDSSGIYSKSDLIEDIAIDDIDNRVYFNSNIFNKILLTEKLDNLIKYNIKDKDIDLLSSNYEIPYMKYDNSYKFIDKNKLYNYLDNKLILSYTSFENYNKCKFKYYLNNILKINIINDDFAIIIGNVCHYVLSNIDKDDFDVYKYFDEYIVKEREFTDRELFFLNNIKEELIFIANTIKKQFTYTTFDKNMYEKKVYVNKDKNIKVSFMGVIDKVLYKEEDLNTYLVVIDYKTGNTDIKMDNMQYGIGMQLPIYLYLSSNMEFKNIKVVGFYLQKLLNNTLDNTKEYDEAREANLKLEGYSVSNENSLSKFDTTYENSKYIKSLKKSSKGFYAYSKVLSEEDMDILIDRTDKLIDKTIDMILEADFSINPKIINGNNVSCNYCEYRDICYLREKDFIYINKEKDGD